MGGLGNGVSTKMIRCPTRRHAKPDDLTNWQVELRTGGQHTPAMIAVLLRESGSRRSLLSPSMQAGIRRLTTSLNNAGRPKFKVRRRTPSDKVLSSSCTESHPRPQWITLSSVEVWLQTCCVNDSFNEIYCSPGTRGVIGLAVARALLQRFPDKSTILIERRTRPGEETR
jgi:hypothetical protein